VRKEAWLEANRERLMEERRLERGAMLRRLRENVAHRRKLAEKNRRKREASFAGARDDGAGRGPLGSGPQEDL